MQADGAVRRAAAWGLAAALIAGLLALTFDTTLLLATGAAPRLALCAGLAAAALAVLLGLTAGPALAWVASLAARAAARSGPVHWLFPVPVAAAAAFLGCLITDIPEKHRPRLHLFVLFTFTAVMTAAAWLYRTRRLSPVVAVFLALAALSTDVAILPNSYRELHDLLSIFAIFCALSLLTPLRRRIAAAAPAPVVIAVCVSIAGSVLFLRRVDDLAPAWRALSTQRARFAPRLARAARALVDLDRDGFSPVAWGGDCDDLDPRKNPFALEHPGGEDRNCDGVPLPAAPGPEHRGLYPAAGAPDLPDGTVDLVLLITVDCLREEDFRPDIMPRTLALSRTGLRFTRAYAAATSTRVATRMMQRSLDESLPVAERLRQAGVPSTAVISLRHGIFDVPLERFTEVRVPPRGIWRWDANRTTDEALEVLRAGDRRYLWVHYFDAHAPYLVHPAAGPPPSRLVPSYPGYLDGLTFIDQAIGRLLAGLRRDGRMGRTMIVFTGDHGEGFGEHGVMFHHASGYEALTHVPGVLVLPGLLPGTYEGLVSHRDLPATILGAFGKSATDPHAEDFGRSWLRLLRAPGAPLHKSVGVRTGRWVGGERGLSPMCVLVQGRYKLVKSLEDELLELYDVIDDPAEQHNLATERLDVTNRLAKDLAIYRSLDQWPRSILYDR